MLRGCLSTLESLIGVSIDHITADKLIRYDSAAMRNLLEIATDWQRPVTATTTTLDDNLDENRNVVDHVDNGQRDHQEKDLANQLANLKIKKNSLPEADHLAYRLYQALKTQWLARELEKKIKEYLGDITAARSNEAIRASRQSVVRTRSILPPPVDFVSSAPSINFAFSVDLERWFPEVTSSLIEQIRFQEKKLLLVERKIGQLGRNMSVPSTFLEMLDDQRKQAEIAAQEKALHQKLDDLQRAQAPPNARQQELITKREARARRACVRNEINDFCKQSAAAYLNARSYLETILAHELHKVDVHQRRHISEIKKCLRPLHELDNERVRLLLESIDKL